jgi:hypothetical protein
VYQVNCTISKANVTSVTQTSLVTVYINEVPTITSIGAQAEYRHTKVKIPVSTVVDFQPVITYWQAVGVYAWSVTPAINFTAATLGTGTSTTTKNLKLVANSLQEGTRYDFTFKAKVDDPSNWAYTTYSLITNRAPHGGTFDVSPNTGSIPPLPSPLA